MCSRRNTLQEKLSLHTLSPLHMFFSLVKTINYLYKPVFYYILCSSIVYYMYMYVYLFTPKNMYKICSALCNLNEAKNLYATLLRRLSYNILRPLSVLFIIVTNTNNNYIFIVYLYNTYIYHFNKNTCTDTFRISYNR